VDRTKALRGYTRPFDIARVDSTWFEWPRGVPVEGER
jgi:hypothetical protein